MPVPGRHKSGLLPALLLAGLAACAQPEQEAVLADSYGGRADLQMVRQQPRHAFADCSTANTRPVTTCGDWITGPAAVRNPKIKMFRRDPTSGNWQPAILHVTDQGWPVMGPDGKKLEIMAYGDTWVENPAYGTLARQADIQVCVKQPAGAICGSNQDCQTAFKAPPDKAETCAYWLAKLYHGNPNKGLALPAFDSENNVVFFDATIDPQSPYRIGFKQHLYHKAVRHNAAEKAPKGTNYFTGVYSTDYFYLCPGTAVACADADKVLHFLTGTVYWHLEQLNVNLLSAAKKHFKLTREGMGIYRFGTLAAKADTTAGCRIAFAPAKGPPAKPPVSCTPGPAEDLRPKDPLYSAPGVTVERSENPNVIWGWGGKFAQAIVMHDFVDSRHGGTSKSSDYVYFLGAAEVTSTKIALYNPTADLYMARLPASQAALAKGQFEYYKGTVTGKSAWGSYDQAKPWLADVLPIAPIFPTSFTKRHGRYYLAAPCGPVHGMCIGSSKDGYIWDKLDYAMYSDLVGHKPSGGASTKLVYGHGWVPAGLYPHASAIPYVFSVWKSADGYAADFWFKSRAKRPPPLDKRFHFYNTKMYLYWPPK